MCLGGGVEVLLDAEVDLEVPSLEPTPSPSSKVRGLRHLGDTKKALVELDGLCLPAGGHRQLHVIQALHAACCHCGRLWRDGATGASVHSCTSMNASATVGCLRRQKSTSSSGRL